MSGNETESWPELPQGMMPQVIAAPPAPAGGFDPYKTMLMKKESDDGSKPIDTTNTIKWPEEDIRKLEEFCKQYGIVGFSCGRMSPMAALALLKAKLGVVDGIPSENVLYSAKHRYGDQFNQKTLLKG